jgi:hypothetical protein
VDPPKYSLFLFSQIKKRRPLFASQRASCQSFCDFFINRAKVLPAKHGNIRCEALTMTRFDRVAI